MASISRAHAAGASAALWLIFACGPSASSKPPAPKVPIAPVLAPRPLAQVFILEAGGSAPEDTVVDIPSGARRVIVLRRSAPDYGLFARLEIPPVVDSAAKPGPIHLTLKPIPGRYGLDLEVTGRMADSATITFSYGAHFVAPAGARERYGSNIAFEKELAIGRVSADGQVIFLPTSRPGSDILSAPLTGPGRYLVAAPR